MLLAELSLSHCLQLVHKVYLSAEALVDDFFAVIIHPLVLSGSSTFQTLLTNISLLVQVVSPISSSSDMSLATSILRSEEFPLESCLLWNDLHTSTIKSDIVAALFLVNSEKLEV